MEYKVKIKYHWSLANASIPTFGWTADATDKKLFKGWKNIQKKAERDCNA